MQFLTLSCVVDPYRSGWRLRDFLAHKFRYLPIAVWDERVGAGRVRVNEAAATAETAVVAGDRVSYEVSADEPSVDFSFAILHEDDDCLAVAKSGNLPVHAGGRYIRNTLIAHLRAKVSPELVLAHRLDRETSGVVLLAKHRTAAAHFEREFHAGRVKKVYRAILCGAVPVDFSVDAPIGRLSLGDSGGPPDVPRWGVCPIPRGKPSVTRFRVLKRGSSAFDPRALLTLVEAIPLSGRTNQIRIHAAHGGHPILGDKVYGNTTAQPPAPPARHLLHAASLEIAAPRGGAPLQLRAPTPPDFALSWCTVASCSDPGFSREDFVP